MSYEGKERRKPLEDPDQEHQRAVEAVKDRVLAGSGTLNEVPIRREGVVESEVDGLLQGVRHALLHRKVEFNGSGGSAGACVERASLEQDHPAARQVDGAVADNSVPVLEHGFLSAYAVGGDNDGINTPSRVAIPDLGAKFRRDILARVYPPAVIVREEAVRNLTGLLVHQYENQAERLEMCGLADEGMFRRDDLVTALEHPEILRRALRIQQLGGSPRGIMVPGCSTVDKIAAAGRSNLKMGKFVSPRDEDLWNGGAVSHEKEWRYVIMDETGMAADFRELGVVFEDPNMPWNGFFLAVRKSLEFLKSKNLDVVTGADEHLALMLDLYGDDRVAGAGRPDVLCFDVLNARGLRNCYSPMALAYFSKSGQLNFATLPAVKMDDESCFSDSISRLVLRAALRVPVRRKG